MSLSVSEYRAAWAGDDASRVRLNSRIIPGTCVLETLAMVRDPNTRYVFVDDFGHAVSYCHQRLLEDLTPPDQRGSDEPIERWWRMRSAFDRAALADAWAAADAALMTLLETFVTDGYLSALGERLREVVNTCGLDLELGEIFVLPQDINALIAYVGNPFVWWDDEIECPEQEREAFDFADARHRAILMRRLLEANEQAV